MADVRILGSAPRVATTRLRPHPRNDNRESSFMFGRLLATIKTDGFADPIDVRSGDDKGPFKDGHLEIVGGEHRWRAATQLGMTEVPIHDYGCIPDALARKLLLTLNKVRGEPDQDALARLVREIAADGGQEALASLPFDDDAIRDLVQDDVEEPSALGLPAEDDLSDAPPVDLASKASAKDLLVLLECQGLPAAQLRPFLETVRQWVHSRTSTETSPWEDLAELLRASH